MNNALIQGLPGKIPLGYPGSIWNTGLEFSRKGEAGDTDYRFGEKETAKIKVVYETMREQEYFRIVFKEK